MSTALRLATMRRRAAPAPPAPPPAALIPIGDQDAYNEATTTWDGLEEAPIIGSRYAPIDVVDDMENLEWAAVSSNFVTGRMHAWGAPELIEDAATILSAYVPVRCGASAGAFRFGIYRDSGNMTAAATDLSAVSAYPGSLIAMSAEQSLPANTAAAVREVPLNTGAVSAGYLWGTYWRSTVATGVEPILAPNGVIARLARSPAGNPSYSSSGSPPATYPSGTTVNRHSGLWWATYRPVAPTAPTGLAATANPDRSISLSWLNTDSRTARARVERRKGAGAWVYAAVVEGASYRDLDLEVGATYEYRVVACYKNAQSAASATASATTTGVRTATITVAPTLLTAAPDDTLRGVYGMTHNLTSNTPPITQQLDYKRAGATLWGDIQPTNDPSYFDWSDYVAFLNDLGPRERGIIRTRHALPRASGSANNLPPFIQANASYWSSITDAGDGRITYFANLAVAQVWTWAQAWIADFGANFANDARVAIVKVGIHNRYGEWTGSMPAAAEISTARQIEVVQAMQAAFPNKKLVMNCATDNDVMWYCAQQDQIIAFEQLALGDLDGPTQWRRFWADVPARVRRKILERRMGLWAEHKSTFANASNYSSGTISRNFISAVYEMEQLGQTMLSDQNMGPIVGIGEPNNSRNAACVDAAGYRFDPVRAQLPAGVARGQPFRAVLHWRNSGNGIYPPIELRWPQLELWQGGALVWAGSPGESVTLHYPSAGAVAVEQALTVTGIPAGSGYQWRLRVPGADAYTTDMALGIAGRQADGSYPLADDVTVL